MQGYPHFMRLLEKQATATGFLVPNFTAAQKKAAMTALNQFIASGQIKVAESKVEGIQNAFSGWLSLYVGKDNIGKKVIVL